MPCSRRAYTYTHTHVSTIDIYTCIQILYLCVCKNTYIYIHVYVVCLTLLIFSNWESTTVGTQKRLLCRDTVHRCRVGHSVKSIKVWYSKAQMMSVGVSTSYGPKLQSSRTLPRTVHGLTTEVSTTSANETPKSGSESSQRAFVTA